MRFRLLLVLAICSLVLVAQAQKVKIESADQLPIHSYKTDLKAMELLESESAMAKLMNEVQADLEADMEKYDLQDKTTLKEYYANLGMIALLEKRYDDYLKYLELRQALEDKESTRLITGLFARAYIKAVRSSSPDFSAVFKKEYAALVDALPFEVVQSEIEAAIRFCRNQFKKSDCRHGQRAHPAHPR